MKKIYSILLFVMLLSVWNATAVSVNLTESNNDQGLYYYNAFVDVHGMDILRIDFFTFNIQNINQNLSSWCYYNSDGSYNESLSDINESGICNTLTITAFRNNATLNNSNGSAFGYGVFENGTRGEFGVSWLASPTYSIAYGYGSDAYNLTVVDGEVALNITFNSTANTSIGDQYNIDFGVVGSENNSAKFIYLTQNSVTLTVAEEQGFEIQKTIFPEWVNSGDNVTYTILLSNPTPMNFTNLTLADYYNATAFTYVSATSTPYHINTTNGTLLWYMNVSENKNVSINITFTAAQYDDDENITNIAVLYNASLDQVENNSAYVVIRSNDTSTIDLDKESPQGNYNVSDIVSYTINLTSRNQAYTNITLIDIFDTTRLDFNSTSIAFDAFNQSSGEIRWSLNLSVNQTILITINFTAFNEGSADNLVIVENQTGQIINDTFNIFINTEPPENFDFTTFNFSAQVEFINGTIPQYINASINVRNFDDFESNTTSYWTTTINGQGNITIDNVSINQSAGEFGELVIYAYTNASRQQINGISPQLFPADGYYFSQIMSGQTIYLSPAVTLNISAINRTGGTVPFQYDITDENFGFPIASSFDEGEEEFVNNTLVTVSSQRGYFIQIMPMMAPPVRYHVNSSELANQSGQIYNIQINTSFSLPEVVGYLHYPNGSRMTNISNMTVFALEVFGSNFLSFESIYPQNLCSEQLFVNLCNTGLHNDTKNASSGFFNISTPGTTTGTTLVWLAFATVGSEYYIGYDAATTNVNDTTVWRNISMTGAYGQVGDFGLGDPIEDLVNVSFIMSHNFTTKKKYLNIWAADPQNTSQNVTLQDLHVELETTRNGQEYVWMLDGLVNNQAAPIILPNDTTVAYARIFSNQFAPKEVQINLSDENQSIELKQFDMFEFDQNGDPVRNNGSGPVNVSLKFYKSSDGCNAIFPTDSGCDLTDIVSASSFDPASLMIEGDVRFDMVVGGSNVKLAFFGADLSASGPPDAIMDTEPLSTQQGEEVWQFGSFAPEIYDYVYIMTPVNDSLYNETDNFTIKFKFLYDEDWNVVWNASDGDNESNLPLEYQDFLPEYEAYFNGTGQSCVLVNETNVTGTTPTQLCYLINTTNFTAVAFKILHFSGMAPTVEVNGGASESSEDDDSGSSGGSSGGGGGGSSGSGSAYVPSSTPTNTESASTESGAGVEDSSSEEQTQDSSGVDEKLQPIDISQEDLAEYFDEGLVQEVLDDVSLSIEKPQEFTIEKRSSSSGKSDVVKEVHSITVNQINYNDDPSQRFVVVTIESDPIKVTVYEGQSVAVDTDNNGIFDVVVSASSISSDSVDVNIGQLSESVGEELAAQSASSALSQENQQVNVNKESQPSAVSEEDLFPESPQESNGLLWISLGVLVAIVIGIFILRSKGNKKSPDLHLEQH